MGGAPGGRCGFLTVLRRDFTANICVCRRVTYFLPRYGWFIIICAIFYLGFEKAQLSPCSIVRAARRSITANAAASSRYRSMILQITSLVIQRYICNQHSDGHRMHYGCTEVCLCGSMRTRVLNIYICTSECLPHHFLIAVILISFFGLKT